MLLSLLKHCTSDAHCCLHFRVLRVELESFPVDMMPCFVNGSETTIFSTHVQLNRNLKFVASGYFTGTCRQAGKPCNGPVPSVLRPKPPILVPCSCMAFLGPIVLSRFHEADPVLDKAKTLQTFKPTPSRYTTRCVGTWSLLVSHQSGLSVVAICASSTASLNFPCSRLRSANPWWASAGVSSSRKTVGVSLMIV